MKTIYDNRIEWRNRKGQLHRLDGPAVEFSSSTKYWYKNGELHRLDGPAVEYDNGDKHWYQNGKRHRLDGPAVEWSSGYKAWYINGKKYLEQEWFEMLSEDKQADYLFKLGET